MGGKTWAIGKPYHPANGPSKNILGVLVETIEYSTNMSEKSFFLYYEMEQTDSFIVKTKSFITQISQPIRMRFGRSQHLPRVHFELKQQKLCVGFYLT